VRRVVRVTAVDGMEGDTITLSDVFLLEGEPGTDGGVGARLRATGVRPKLVERLHEAGVTLPADAFGAAI